MKLKIFLFVFAIVFLVGIAFSAEESSTSTSSETMTFELGIFENIGRLIGSGLEDMDIIASGVELDKDDEGINTLTFLEGGTLNIKGKLFEDVESGSSIKLNSKGEPLFANLLASDSTSFDFNDKGTYQLSKGNRLTLNNGLITVMKDKGENTFKFRQEILDDSGKNIGSFINIKMNGDAINLNKIDGGNVITGNFDFLNNKIKGIGEGANGRITLSKDGKISEIWSGTDTLTNNINFKVSGQNVKLYYGSDFNPLDHKGENYFNYDQDKLFVGGNGFTTNLGNQNNVFGNMKSTTYIKNVGTKERDFEVNMEGGFLEISKDASSSDLAFNIQHEGDFVIKNGDVVIHSQRGYVIENGKRVLSDENSIFLKTDSSKDFSYDINFNNGEYELESGIFKDSLGNVIVNSNTPEETAIYKMKGIDSDKILEVSAELKEEIGARPRNYISMFDDAGKEELIGYFNTAVDSANKNIYGVEISTEELWTRYMLEGGGYYKEGYPIYDYERLGASSDVSGSHVGLDFIKSNEAALEKGGFLENGFLDEFVKENAPLNEQQLSMQTVVFDTTENSIIAFAGELARRKYVFQKDFKSAFGEEEFNSMSDDEGYFWLNYYFNAGEGAGKGELTGARYNTYNSDGESIVVQGKGRENLYKPWVGAEPGEIESGIGLGKSARFNSLLGVSTYNFIKRLGIFDLF